MAHEEKTTTKNNHPITNILKAAINTKQPIKLQKRENIAQPAQSSTRKPHVVIIGAGFGGLAAAKGLRDLAVDVTLIDQNNFHLFQPMLYQVATAGLSSVNISAPIREIIRKQHNAEVLLAEVTGIDPQQQKVLLKDKTPLSYDYLILATGASTNYFQHPEWQTFAPSMKTISDALLIRNMLLNAFEQAEYEPDEEKRRKLLTFVLIGAGPTGVELAGSMAELTQKTLLRDFHHLHPHQIRIILVDAMPRILVSFPAQLSQKANQRLHRLGVEIKTGQMVTNVQQDGITLMPFSSNKTEPPAEQTFLETTHMIWTAGVLASPAGKWLRTSTDKNGRVQVNADLSIPGYSNIFVIGDTATRVQNGNPLPGVAPVAIQEGHYVTQIIAKKVKNSQKKLPPFRYVDQGTMTIVGRAYAIVSSGPLKTAGFIGWLLWIGVHIANLINFRNRLAVTFQYAWNYLTYQRSARIMHAEPCE
ncbi:MAG TPA: NAD(P)/FAD-dependent oxidoreductase [Dictyobacter sp.]|jgi:NADH dehydrogenase|nr:NAD(P)/FAD-dependent oxidoreductase [Dictyobacter sp.]